MNHTQAWQPKVAWALGDLYPELTERSFICCRREWTNASDDLNLLETRGRKWAEEDIRERRTGHRRAYRRQLIAYMAADKWTRVRVYMPLYSC